MAENRQMTSDKEGIHLLTEILVKKGVTRAVLSPGSRNAPLLIAFAREERIEHFVVLDERSAAFFALGLAQQSGEAVALVCTSGTALLNYAPAIAEAYYQRLPLVILSADRPVEWIDQDDSQTIRQKEVFRNIVKASYQLPAELRGEEEHWYANRLVNDAINCALGGRKGPVHLNVPLQEPLYGMRLYSEETERVIKVIGGERIENKVIRELAQNVSACPKVMILAGFHGPDKELRQSIGRLSTQPNVVVLSETLSNLGTESSISTIDRVLATLEEDEKKALAPNLLITYGGPLISRHVKVFLRTYSPCWHWSIDPTEHSVDTLKALTMQVKVAPEVFFPSLAAMVEASDSDYATCWQEKKALAEKRHRNFERTVSWSDWQAFSRILPSLPQGSALQLANSTVVRYAQLFEYPQLARVDGNRGTSGIDGSTSTAVGAAWLNPGITVLITGDMSFLYDSNALWNKYITPRLKIIVMKNGGGGIFRFLPGSSEVEELEECFATGQEVNVEGFAAVHHFRYFYAAEPDSLQSVLPEFFAESGLPALLDVDTSGAENAEILKAYFRSLRG